MEFRQLEAFVNAVKYKSFSKAADATFLPQPTISAHINNLENEMGTTLVNRTGREITLTKQGELFYPYAIDMLHTRSQALATVQAQCEAMDGVLDVYASSIPGQYYLPRLIGEYHAKCPKIRFYVEQSDSKTVIEDVMSQKGEIGLTGYKMHNSLVYEPVFMDELVLIVPDTEKYSRWKKGSTVSFRDFEHETFILREEGSGTKQEMEKAEIHGVPVFKNVDVNARMNSTAAIKQAVAGGRGRREARGAETPGGAPGAAPLFCGPGRLQRDFGSGISAGGAGRRGRQAGAGLPPGARGRPAPLPGRPAASVVEINA